MNSTAEHILNDHLIEPVDAGEACTCGWAGTGDEAMQHAHDVGLCSGCLGTGESRQCFGGDGSGIGICPSCGGAGTAAAETATTAVLAVQDAAMAEAGSDAATTVQAKEQTAPGKDAGHRVTRMLAAAWRIVVPLRAAPLTDTVDASQVRKGQAVSGITSFYNHKGRQVSERQRVRRRRGKWPTVIDAAFYKDGEGGQPTVYLTLSDRPHLSFCLNPGDKVTVGEAPPVDGR